MIKEQSIPQIHTFTEVKGPMKSKKGKSYWIAKSTTGTGYYIWQENAEVAITISKNIGVGIKVAVIEGQFPQIVALEASEVAKFVGSLAQDRIQEDIDARVKEKREIIAWNSSINNAVQMIARDIVVESLTNDQKKERILEWANWFYPVILDNDTRNNTE